MTDTRVAVHSDGRTLHVEFGVPQETGNDAIRSVNWAVSRTGMTVLAGVFNVTQNKKS